MLGETDLYAAPDDTLEVWCLLVLDYTCEEGVEAWQVGFANVNQIVRTESLDSSSTDGEANLLGTLVTDYLDPHRNEDFTTTLITPSGDTITMLRRRLLANDIEASFRGYRHISVQHLIDEYFQLEQAPEEDLVEFDLWGGNDQLATTDVESVMRLWKTLNSIGPIVPRQAMAGTRL